MSGGSWDYFYSNLEDVALRLKGKEQTPLRRALGNLLLQCSKAMHDIEWNDSGDGSDTEEENIRKCLGKDANRLELAVVIAEAKEIKKELKRLLNERP